MNNYSSSLGIIRIPIAIPPAIPPIRTITAGIIIKESNKATRALKSGAEETIITTFIEDVNESYRQIAEYEYETEG